MLELHDSVVDSISREGEQIMARRTKLAVAAMAAALIATMGATGIATSSDAAPHIAKRDASLCC